MATYVLVGGAWIGGWAYRGVARRLRERGHDVYPLTLTGLGERVHLGGPDVNLETHIADVVNLLRSEDLTEVVLVGHSYATFVVTGVADRAPDRLAQLVYLDAGPVGDGARQLDFYPPEAATGLQRVVEEQGDGWALPFPSFEELAESASLAGLGEAELELLRAKAAPHPFQTYLQPLSLTGTGTGDYGRAVITCSDGGLTVAQLKDMIASGDPMGAALTGPGWRFLELPTGHWPMLSMPQELSLLLHDLGMLPAASPAPDSLTGTHATGERE